MSGFVAHKLSGFRVPKEVMCQHLSGHKVKQILAAFRSPLARQIVIGRVKSFTVIKHLDINISSRRNYLQEINHVALETAAT
jgi:hypothetical protein